MWYINNLYFLNNLFYEEIPKLCFLKKLKIITTKFWHSLLQIIFVCHCICLGKPLMADCQRFHVQPLVKTQLTAPALYRTFPVSLSFTQNCNCITLLSLHYSIQDSLRLINKVCATLLQAFMCDLRAEVRFQSAKVRVAP